MKITKADWLEIEDLFDSIRGTIQQLNPQYSAKLVIDRHSTTDCHILIYGEVKESYLLPEIKDFIEYLRQFGDYFDISLAADINGNVYSIRIRKDDPPLPHKVGFMKRLYNWIVSKLAQSSA